MKKSFVLFSLFSTSLLALTAGVIALKENSFANKVISDTGDYTITINPDDITTSEVSVDGSAILKTDQLKNDVNFSFENVKRDGNCLVIEENGYIANRYDSQIRSIKSFTVYGDGVLFDYSFGWEANGNVVDYEKEDYSYANDSDIDLSSYTPNYLKISRSGTNLQINKIIITFDRQCVAGENPYVSKDGLNFYKSNHNHVIVLGFSGKSITNVVIPDTIDGLPVTEIADSAFANDSYIETVSLGTNLTKIGRSAFSYDDNIVSVSGMNRLTYIDESAFEGASSLEGDISFSSYLSYIGSMAFANTNINSITFADVGNPEVATDAFKECTQLESVHIGSQMNRFSEVFNGDENLTTITVGEGNQTYSVVDDVLLNNELNYVQCVPMNRSQTTLTIPSGYDLSEYCAYDNKNLENLVLNDVISYIPDNAFSYCENLRSINFGTSGYIEIGNSFEGCISLDTLTIPSNVMSIHQHAFKDCENLQTVIIREGCQRIDCEAFLNCYNLQTVVLPSTLTSLGQDNGLSYESNDLFGNCDNVSIFTTLTEGYYEGEEVIDGWNNDRDLYWYSEEENTDGYHWRWNYDTPEIWE